MRQTRPTPVGAEFATIDNQRHCAHSAQIDQRRSRKVAVVHREKIVARSGKRSSDLCKRFEKHANQILPDVGNLGYAIGETASSRGLRAAWQLRSRQDPQPHKAAEAPAYPEHERLMVVRDGQGGERAIRTPADWQVRRDHILAHFQEVAGTLPGGERRVPLDMQVISTQKEQGFIRKKITFATEPGDRVPAWLLIPDRPDAARPAGPAVLCLHQTIAIGKDEPAGLGKNLELAYARELAERGYVALAPDYPNFGEYKVDVYELGYASATMKAIWNNLRAVDLLCSLEEVDPRPNRRDRPLPRRPQRDLHGALRSPVKGGGLVLRLQRVPVLLQREYRRLVAPGLHAAAPRSVTGLT